MSTGLRRGKNDRLPELTADLVRLKVDLIVVTATPAALAAKNASTVIPIVMANSSDPVGAGSGYQWDGREAISPAELNTKRLEILKDAVPRLARVGLPRSPGASIGRDLQLKELRVAATALKLKLKEIETELDAKGLLREDEGHKLAAFFIRPVVEFSKHCKKYRRPPGG